MNAIRRAYRLATIASIAVIAAPICLAQAPQKISAPPAATSPAQPIDLATLVIGEQYAVTAQRVQVYQRYEGSLIAANADWIVLRRVREVQNEPTANDVGMIPQVEGWFKTKTTTRETLHTWIPRSAITQCERTASTSVDPSQVQQASAQLPPRPAPLQNGTDCAIALIEGGQVEVRQGKLSKIAGGKLTLACRQFEIRDRPPAGPSRVPIFGEFFREQQEVVAKTTIQTHSLDKILAIHVPIEMPLATK